VTTQVRFNDDTHVTGTVFDSVAVGFTAISVADHVSLEASLMFAMLATPMPTHLRAKRTARDRRSVVGVQRIETSQNVGGPRRLGAI
jgi:hypothetical protein